MSRASLGMKRVFFFFFFQSHPSLPTGLQCSEEVQKKAENETPIILFFLCDDDDGGGGVGEGLSCVCV